MANRNGMGGHQSAAAKSVVWLTPKPIIDALGPFDLDPAAAAPRPWDTATDHFTETEDGLSKAWHGRVWLNPPYTNPILGRFLHRMAEHGRGTALIFARTETDCFHRYVWGAADAVLFLRGRLHFIHPSVLPDGSPELDGGGRPVFKRATANAGAPSVLVAYGADDTERLIKSGIDGKLVPISSITTFYIGVRSMPDLTWQELIRAVMDRQAGSVISLQSLYALVRHHPKTTSNQNVEAKVRQTLRRMGARRVDRGQYELAFVA